MKGQTGVGNNADHPACSRVGILDLGVDCSEEIRESESGDVVDDLCAKQRNEMISLRIL